MIKHFKSYGVNPELEGGTGAPYACNGKSVSLVVRTRAVLATNDFKRRSSRGVGVKAESAGRLCTADRSPHWIGTGSIPRTDLSDVWDWRYPVSGFQVEKKLRHKC